jgi:chemotaxis protein methyltransferase CheR
MDDRMHDDLELMQSGEDLEIRLLITALYEMYGHDFRGYKLTSLRSRLRYLVRKHSARNVSELQHRVVHDRSFAEAMRSDLTVTVTEPFRDPAVFKLLRDEVIPWLRTFPEIKIWHAGCSTGDEAFSMAILLEEEGLLQRSTIYASDVNPTAITRASQGLLSSEALATGTTNLLAAGGRRPFSDYLITSEVGHVVRPSLRERIVFFEHDLATDASLGEMQLIFCRNVLIYFDAALQERVARLLVESLGRGGFLCFGQDESLPLEDPGPAFDLLDPRIRLYRRQTDALQTFSLGPRCVPSKEKL